MKRSRFYPLRVIYLFTLAGLFLYTASVQEVHYLFVDHHTELNEHCHNHLHTRQGHVECNLCKIELSSYVQSFKKYNYSAPLFSNDLKTYGIQDIKLNSRHSFISLRGPPVLI